MRKRILLILLSLPLTAAAQGIVTVPEKDCVWRAGDNPAWAAPSLDESGWQPFEAWRLPGTPHYWIRCHAELSSLRMLAHPALMVYHDTAYQLYLDGALVGTSGSPQSGFSRVNTYLIFPVKTRQIKVSQIEDSHMPAGQASTIAIRSFLRIPPIPASLPDPTLHLLAGDVHSLREHRDSLALAGAANWLAVTIGFGVIGVTGLVLLGLYCFDRTRRDLLILAFQCWGLSGGRGVVQMLFAVHVGIWGSEYGVLFLVTLIGTHLTAFCAYWLNRRPVPLFYKIVTALCMFNFLYGLCGLLLPLDAAYGYELLELRAGTFFTACSCILSSSLIAAFLPWRTVSPSRRPLAICCFLWGTVDLIFLLPLTASRLGPNLAVFFQDVQPRLLEVRSIGIIATIIALVMLAFRDQQRTARERAELAGEMHAASEIQQMLAPARLETAPGLKIEVAFRPMREVGGDFYLCRVLPDGRQRVLLGDVSGKGAAAAMAATLILGAASARNSDSPSNLLAYLNRALLENHLTGFATCLCADIAPDGIMTLANAGHLPPYRDGQELKIDAGLPLGIVHHVEYSETALQLASGESLTFLSDGVVEARSRSGELFGFDRAAELSSHSAEEIARAAQAFGQEDDITVLTLGFAPIASPA